jgi:hypothetical protein
VAIAATASSATRCIVEPRIKPAQYTIVQLDKGPEQRKQSA